MKKERISLKGLKSLQFGNLFNVSGLRKCDIYSVLIVGASVIFLATFFLTVSSGKNLTGNIAVYEYFMAAAGKPDLTVTGFDCRPHSVNTLWCDIGVENIGKGNAKENFNVLFVEEARVEDWKGVRKSNRTLASETIIYLRKGSYENFSVSTFSFMPGKKYRILVEVDKNHHIDELDETNNLAVFDPELE